MLSNLWFPVRRGPQMMYRLLSYRYISLTSQDREMDLPVQYGGSRL